MSTRQQRNTMPFFCLIIATLPAVVLLTDTATTPLPLASLSPFDSYPDAPVEEPLADVHDGQDPHDDHHQQQQPCHAERCPVHVDPLTGDLQCPAGYVETSDWDFCVDVDECSDFEFDVCDQSFCVSGVGDDDACYPSACVNSFGSFACACEDGYVLGRKCVEATAGIWPPRQRTFSSGVGGGGLVWLCVVIAVPLAVILFSLAFWLVKSRRALPSVDQQLNTPPRVCNEI